MRGRLDGWSRAGRLRGSAAVAKRNRVRLLAAIGLLMLLGVTMMVHLRPAVTLGNETSSKAQLPGMLQGEVFQCDRSQFRTDICNMRGDIRLEYINTTRAFVLYARDASTAAVREEMVKPYTRKWEKSCMDTVHEVALRSVPAPLAATPKACDVHHRVPAVVFSTGGYTGNLYHEFHDGLIPLFITSQHLKREVVFVVSEFHDWWLTKYNEVIRQMSKYPVINLENETRVHCFPEIEAGLHIHAELGVDPDLMPHHESIRDFRNLLRRAYRPHPGENIAKDGVPKLRLTIIVRNGTRRFLNLDKIVQAAEEIGFNVALLIPDPTMELKRIYWLLNNTDVLLGVHGAAMTHFLFMRPGTVFIQVIPLGTDWAAFTYYGEPAKKLGLHYLPYKIELAESSLSDKYAASDPILRDPASIVEKGWWTMKEIYLEGQDVRPSLTRMRRVLKQSQLKLRPNPSKQGGGQKSSDSRLQRDA